MTDKTFKIVTNLKKGLVSVDNKELPQRFSDKLVEINKDGSIVENYVWGYASTDDIDSTMDKVTRGALEKAVDRITKSPYNKIHLNHKLDETPSGFIIDAFIDDKGMMILGGLNSASPRFEEITKSLGMFLDSFSIDGIVKPENTSFNNGVVEVNDLDLFGVSIVGTPANPNSKIQGFELVKKSLAESLKNTDEGEDEDNEKGDHKKPKPKLVKKAVKNADDNDDEGDDDNTEQPTESGNKTETETAEDGNTEPKTDTETETADASDDVKPDEDEPAEKSQERADELMKENKIEGSVDFTEGVPSEIQEQFQVIQKSMNAMGLKLKETEDENAKLKKLVGKIPETDQKFKKSYTGSNNRQFGGLKHTEGDEDETPIVEQKEARFLLKSMGVDTDDEDNEGGD